MIRPALLASACVLGLNGLSAKGKCADVLPPPLDIGSEQVLLLDDWTVEKTDLKRVVHPPVKQGLIKEADGTDWERGDCYAANGCTVVRDKSGRLHMTYRYIWWDPAVKSLHPGIGEDRAHWFRQSMGYATSDDGIRWHKPKLGLVDAPVRFKQIKEFPFQVPDGVSKENNLGYPIDFALDLHASGNVHDPKTRFLLLVVEKEDTHPFAKNKRQQLYFAEDWPDVIGDPQWEAKLSPISGGQLSPRGFRTVVGYDQSAKVWFQTAQDTIGNWRPRGGRDIARFASTDLVNWGKGELVLPVAKDESREASDWVEYMYLHAYRVGGPRAGAWLGQLEVFHSDRSDAQFEMPTIKDVWRKGTVEQRLVLSRDAGLSWARIGGKTPWLPHHAEEHGYDRLAFGAAPVRVKDEVWFYYPAWDGDHLIFRRDGELYRSGFIRTGRTARAVLRWNGYVSLDAEKSGELVTKVIRFEGGKLAVNLRAPQGSLRAEIQDPSGQPLPGLSLADCIAATGDGVELPVNWKDSGALERIAGKPVRVRLVLTKGSLYSFGFGSGS